jgi:hypothetical protein
MVAEAHPELSRSHSPTAEWQAARTSTFPPLPKTAKPTGVATAKVYLCCPFGQKDECKKLGGRWDPGAKKWYVPKGHKNVSCFAKWM